MITSFFKKSTPLGKQEENVSRIPAIKYNHYVARSPRAGFNGDYSLIPEIYVPSIRCVYNEEAIYRSNKPRYSTLIGIRNNFMSSYVEVMLPKDLVDRLEQYLIDKEKLKHTAQMLHDSQELIDALDLLSPIDIKIPNPYEPDVPSKISCSIS